jgi:hypothetical protein
MTEQQQALLEKAEEVIAHAEKFLDLARRMLGSSPGDAK